MNIVLIGYRCAGKSVVGKRLAERLRRRFVDTDDLIEERSGCTIHEIVEFHGWDHFRAMERRTIEEISNEDQLVISPGGGAVLQAANVSALKRNGLIIWLKADREVTLKRIEKDTRNFVRRPSLTGKGILEELEEVMASRDSFYERAAEIKVDTSALDVEAVVEAVQLILQERMERA